MELTFFPQLFAFWALYFRLHCCSSRVTKQFERKNSPIAKLLKNNFVFIFLEFVGQIKGCNNDLQQNYKSSRWACSATHFV